MTWDEQLSLDFFAGLLYSIAVTLHGFAMVREFTFKITGVGKDRLAVAFTDLLTVEVHNTDLDDEEAKVSALDEAYSQVCQRVFGDRGDVAFLNVELIQENSGRLIKSPVRTFTLEEFIKRNKHGTSL